MRFSWLKRSLLFVALCFWYNAICAHLCKSVCIRFDLLQPEVDFFDLLWPEVDFSSVSEMNH